MTKTILEWADWAANSETSKDQKGSSRTRQRCWQGKWKRNKEVEERNGAGLLRSSVVKKASILTLERVQHIKNFMVTPPKPNLYGTYRVLL
jgi:hypothetical protein